MAGIVYLKLKGEVQGDIQGLSTQTGFDREGSIECTAFSLRVVKPHDRNTGMPTGRRYYEPLTFVKDIDQATPAIAKALVSNEKITEAVFRFFDMVGSNETLVYTVKTEGGHIASQRQFVADIKDPALAPRPNQEEVGLVFQKITGTWESPNIEFSDSWGTQT